MKKVLHRTYNKLMRFWWVLPTLIVIGSTAGAAKIMLKPNQTKLEDCYRQNTNEFSCWKARYEAYVSNDDIKGAFIDVKHAYDTVPFVKTQCHQIAHVIGRAAGHKFKDVSAAYSQGDNFCWSGYYHGVMQAVADDMGVDGVMKNINQICKTIKDKQEYSFYHYNCVHGLGHGIMAVENNQLFTALEKCDLLEGDWQQASCYGGVYMENVMSEINPDHKTKYLKADDPLYPCTAVATKYKEQCYLMQTSHALIVLNSDYAKVAELCSGVEAPLDSICFQSLGRDASGNSSSDPARTKQICLAISTYAGRNNCMIGAVKDFIAYFHSDTQGLALCASLEEVPLRDSCTATAHEYYKSF
jgi:hypothetical protein